MSDLDHSPKKTSAAWVRSAAFLLLAVGLVLAARYLGLLDHVRAALVWIGAAGWVGVGAYALLYVVACLLFIPGSIITLGAGAIYGLLYGTITVSLASTLGATAAFLTGRYLARHWLLRRLEGNAVFRGIDQAVTHEGWRIVGLTRLSPVFPFNFLNYAYGLTGVSLRDYVLASWIGMLPGTIMYAYLGSLAGSVAGLGGLAPTRQRTTAEWLFYGLGLFATIAVATYVARMARRALAEKLPT